MFIYILPTRSLLVRSHPVLVRDQLLRDHPGIYIYIISQEPIVVRGLVEGGYHITSHRRKLVSTHLHTHTRTHGGIDKYVST
jgi:hypothetical protein